jgi:hypothetical protein
MPIDGDAALVAARREEIRAVGVLLPVTDGILPDPEDREVGGEAGQIERHGVRLGGNQAVVEDRLEHDGSVPVVVLEDAELAVAAPVCGVPVDLDGHGGVGRVVNNPRLEGAHGGALAGGLARDGVEGLFHTVVEPPVLGVPAVEGGEPARRFGHPHVSPAYAANKANGTNFRTNRYNYIFFNFYIMFFLFDYFFNKINIKL